MDTVLAFSYVTLHCCILNWCFMFQTIGISLKGDFIKVFFLDELPCWTLRFGNGKAGQAVIWISFSFFLFFLPGNFIQKGAAAAVAADG